MQFYNIYIYTPIFKYVIYIYILITMFGVTWPFTGWLNIKHCPTLELYPDTGLRPFQT